MSPGAGQAAGPTLIAEFVGELVTAEDDRRKSLEARGSAVITVSGTLVTLLLGLAALITKAQSFVLSETARQRLSFAVVAFVVAVLLAIASHAPQPARITAAADLKGLVPDLWVREGDFAAKKLTATRLDQLEALQTANDRKALVLLAAVAAQVIAVALLGWTVLGVL